MIIEQFEDRQLSHYSYALLNEEGQEIILIDPSRNTAPYLSFAARHAAKIIGVIETHPHADFVSSHLELYQTTGATIYSGSRTGAIYPHQAFDEGDTIRLGDTLLRALNTPGHSPDSICIVLQQKEKDIAVFTGDTLFIGDCGRPDLRENAGNLKASRKFLSAQMYHSLRDKLMTLADEVIVYPAHGAGTLCGKSLSTANSSTIGEEKATNWCLQPMTEEAFSKELLSEQPFIPKYFGYAVECNKTGAPSLQDSIRKIPVVTWEKPGSKEDPLNDSPGLDPKYYVIDTRDQALFAAGHLKNSIHIMEQGKFETWLGSIVDPHEKFYLVAESTSRLQEMMKRTASIGYEPQIEQAIVLAAAALPITGNPTLATEAILLAPTSLESTTPLDVTAFAAHKKEYTIVDVRNVSERKAHPIFAGSLGIPLGELRERAGEIPLDKPVAVHCAGGYRSAAGSSLLQAIWKDKTPVFDIGEAIKTFSK